MCVLSKLQHSEGMSQIFSTKNIGTRKYPKRNITSSNKIADVYLYVSDRKTVYWRNSNAPSLIPRWRAEACPPVVSITR